MLHSAGSQNTTGRQTLYTARAPEQGVHCAAMGSTHGSVVSGRAHLLCLCPGLWLPEAHSQITKASPLLSRSFSNVDFYLWESFEIFFSLECCLSVFLVFSSFISVHTWEACTDVTKTLTVLQKCMWLGGVFLP